MVWRGFPESESELKDTICKFDNVQPRKERKERFWASGHQQKAKNECIDVLLERTERNGRNVGIEEQANIACMRIKAERNALGFLFHTIKNRIQDAKFMKRQI